MTETSVQVTVFMLNSSFYVGETSQSRNTVGKDFKKVSMCWTLCDDHIKLQHLLKVEVVTEGTFLFLSYFQDKTSWTLRWFLIPHAVVVRTRFDKVRVSWKLGENTFVCVASSK